MSGVATSSDWLTKGGSPPALEDRWWRPFCTAGDATVFHVDLSPQPDVERTALRWLSREEQDRWRKFRLEPPRREFALCRAALRVILCRWLSCTNGELAFEEGQHGKPAAHAGGRPASIHFNVSHSGRHGLIALAARGRLGVDVEVRDTRRNLDMLIDEALTAEEKSRLAGVGASCRRRLFFRIWTMKEALIKALGKGFSLNVSELEIPPALCNGPRLGDFRFPHIPGVLWRLENLGNAEFAAAIAHECSRQERPVSESTTSPLLP